MFLIFFGLFLESFSFLILHSDVTFDSDTYKAGSVHLVNKLQADEYAPFIKSAKDKGVDILVFPEMAVVQKEFQGAENVTVGENPCDDSSPDAKPIQYKISCAAKEDAMYTVFDFIERGDNCVKNVDPYCHYDYFIHNTAVVLDNKGTIIQKYRKTHMFAPEVKDYKPGDGNPVTFEVFGVKFGVFICFDIMFSIPATTLVKNGVEHFVYPTWWDDHVPAASLPVQSAWSELHKVNLIAANYIVDSTGSGIYHHGNPLTITEERNKNVLLIADIPKSTGERLETTIMKSKNSLTIHQDKADLRIPIPRLKFFHAKVGASGSVSFDLPSFICNISYVVGSKSSEKDWFALVGVENFKEVSEFIDVCGLYGCGHQVELCELMKNSNTETYFDKLETIMVYKEKEPDFVLPLRTTESEMILVPIDQFSFEQESKKYTIKNNNSTQLVLSVFNMAVHVKK